MKPTTKPTTMHQDINLDNGQVHLWKVRLDLPEDHIKRLRLLLSEDELDRAGRFKMESHAKRFIACRGQLRLCLSRYTGIAPTELLFTKSSLGKPLLSGSELCFSVSHSQDLALFGLSKHTIGVDLEKTGLVKDVDGVAQRFFSERENDMLRMLEGDEKHEHFLDIWTWKEAYLKATGEGFAGLDSISSACLGTPTCESFVDRKGKHWHASPLSPAEGFKGNFVVEGDAPEVQYFDLNTHL
jgi:4'-phosphopantetheinyl transferase